MKRFETEGIVGTAHLEIGRGNKGVIEYRQQTPTGERLGACAVVTMRDGRVTALKEVRRTSTARKMADIDRT